MSDRRRPLSPHLQVYRLPITGLLSISHRITGVLLSFALISVVYVLACIALGDLSYQALQQQMISWLGKLIYVVFIYALVFHLCHGLRHLIWDIGKGFNRNQLTRFSLYELFASVVLTIVWLSLSF
jgi:succinate dehydrogenase / fumarate reductase cytochrome b subunit